ncbi:MAG: hypothetical protein ACTHNW_14365 [Mucilaginibacter sp.]
MDRLDYHSEPSHYIKLIASAALVLIGIYMHLADFKYSSPISVVIVLIGAFFIFRTIFRIMEEPAN